MEIDDKVGTGNPRWPGELRLGGIRVSVMAWLGLAWALLCGLKVP